MITRANLLELEQSFERAVRVTVAPLQLRSAAADGTGDLIFDGYSCITGHWYTMYGGPPYGWDECVAGGGFRKTLSEQADVQLLVNHEGAPLARTKSGTMDLEEDDQGEHVIARLNPADPDVQAIAPKLQRGDIDEMSFAFRIVRQRWEDLDGNEADPMTAPRRRILEVNQHRGDVAICNHGANDATFGALRSLGAGQMLDDNQFAVLRQLFHQEPAEDDTPRTSLSLRLARAQADALALRSPAA